MRVGEVSADSRPSMGLKIDAQRVDETEVGLAKTCTITEVSPSSKSTPDPQFNLVLARLHLDSGADGLLDSEVFESIMSPGKLLILGSWRDKSAAGSWTPMLFATAGEVRHREVRVIRDYGMFERREAPQCYPMVERSVRERCA